MRFAIVTPFGAEERLDHFGEFLLAQKLIQRGDQVQLFTYRMRAPREYRRDGVYKGVPTVRCSQRLGCSPKLWWRIVRLKPDVVVLCHVRSYLNWTAEAAARLIGARTIFFVIGFLHDPDIVMDRDRPLETLRPDIRLSSRLSDVFCQTRRVGLAAAWRNYVFHTPFFRAKTLVAYTPFERDMIAKITGRQAVVIPEGISARMDGSERQPLSADGRLLPEAFLFFLGQIKKRKGWDTAIEALSILKRRGVIKSLVLVTSSGPNEVAAARSFAASLGVADQVIFLIRVNNDEKRWLFRRAEATLAPSRYEGFGLPVFESFAAGTPVLGTDIPVYRDFLHDGETGLVSPSGDAVSLAANIERLNDRNLRNKIIEGGRRMLLNYTDDAMLQKFLALLPS